MRRRCCCYHAAFRFLDAFGDPSPYGRIKLLDGSTVMFDDVPGLDGWVYVPIPSAIFWGWDLEVSEVPRAADAFVASIVMRDMATSPGTMFKISPLDRDYFRPQYHGGGPDPVGIIGLGPGTGYGYMTCCRYHQVDTLSMTDSVAGSASLAWTGYPTSAYVAGPIAVGSNYIRYSLFGNLGNARSQTKINYGSPGGPSATAILTAAPTSQWTPDGGGSLAWSASGVRWPPSNLESYSQSVTE